MAEECKVDCITLNRRLLDWEWYQDMPTKVLFIHLLLKANWKDGKFMGVDIPRGSLATSYPKLSTQLGISVRQIRTALKHLKATGEVTVKTYPKFSLITIVKYNDYQWSDTQSDSQVTGERQASDNNRIKKKGNKEKNNNMSVDTDEFFKELYQTYPKHVGKTKGYTSYCAWLKGKRINGQTIRLDQEQIRKGFEKYYLYMLDKNNGEVGDLKYWKNFDTIMNQINDWGD